MKTVTMVDAQGVPVVEMNCVAVSKHFARRQFISGWGLCGATGNRLSCCGIGGDGKVMVVGWCKLFNVLQHHAYGLHAEKHVSIYSINDKEVTVFCEISNKSSASND